MTMNEKAWDLTLVYSRDVSRSVKFQREERTPEFKSSMAEAS